MLMKRVALLFLVAAVCGAQNKFRGWEVSGGTSENIHYSSLSQINARNVQNLRVAWTFDSGDAYPDSGIECNPIVVDGVLYATSPKLLVFAVDAATGKKIWSFDGLHGGRPIHKNRGLTYWTDGKQS